MKRLIKKISRDIMDRDEALVYIDGKILSDHTHAKCINKYLEQQCNTELYDQYSRPYELQGNSSDPFDYQLDDMQKIKDNIKQMAFAHITHKTYKENEEDNSIYIEKDTLFNIDIDTVINAMKIKYPNYNIYIDETNQKVARLKKLCYDSSNVAPNGIIWNDDIWDTYDTKKQYNTNIDRTWQFEKPIDNQEWNLQK